MKNRISTKETVKHIGQQVYVAGWVNTKRSHGKILFIDLRDMSGLLLVVFPPGNETLVKLAQSLKPEYVVGIKGEVKERPDGMQNPKLETGKIELAAEELEILNESKTPPFEITADSKEVKEEIRLKYRYLDLRTERMKNNLILRHKVIKYIRDQMDKKGFIEIETPLLTRATPEGARDFLVPSRLHSGKFYALPQSPQQYKQLLMVAGIEKYFQIAKCLRDEDPRADRSVEHSQLDIEMSFVEQEDILNLLEELYVGLVKDLLPEKRITKIPFPRLDYETVIKKYKTDKPDLRKDKKDPNELAFCWILNWPLFEYNQDEKRYDPMHHVFTSPQEKDLPLLEKEPLKVRSWQHDLALNGYEVAGGSIRINNREIQEKIFKLVGVGKKEAQVKFGHLLKAFEYGAPREGGIASGLERFIMLLAGEDNIREVMAFPKTGDGWDPLMDSPAEASPEQLKELHIEIRKKKAQ